MGGCWSSCHPCLHNDFETLLGSLLDVSIFLYSTRDAWDESCVTHLSTPCVAKQQGRWHKNPSSSVTNKQTFSFLVITLFREVFPLKGDPLVPVSPSPLPIRHLVPPKAVPHGGIWARDAVLKPQGRAAGPQLLSISRPRPTPHLSYSSMARCALRARAGLGNGR